MSKEIIETWKEEVNKITGGSILSIKILFPLNESLKSLEQILIIEELKYKNYKKFEEKYTNIANSPDSISRSLTFLKYENPVKYKDLNNPQKDCPENIANLEYYREPVIEISSSEIKALSNDSQVDDWWGAWCDLIPEHFDKSKSTLWTYINIRTLPPLICSCYLIFSKKLEKKTRHIVNKVCQDYLYQLVLHHFETKLFSTALKSSLAAVMARNMSHNIGSHVLNKLSEEKSVTEFLERYNIENDERGHFYVDLILNPKRIQTKDGVYEVSKFLVPSKIYDGVTINENCKLTGSVQEYLKCLQNHATPTELIRVFNDYLKKRMDFVADVATANSTSIMFSKPIFSEVFKSFEKNLLLLAHISGKEKVFKYKFNFTVNGKNYDPEKPNDVAEPLGAMPNDVLGAQAFCIILENIIRNTAKHAKINWKEETRIIFTIDVNTNYCDEFLKMTIYDDSNKYIKDIPKELIKKRNESIKEPVLTAENVLRAEGWGTIELKIAACYLSRLDLDKIDDPEYSPIMDESIGEGWAECKENNWRIKDEKTYYPILQAVEGVKTDENLDTDNVVEPNDNVANEEGLPKTKFFGYSFLIKKPKDLLIIDTKGVIEKSFGKPLDSTIYKNLGVEILTEIPKNLTSENIYFYDILLVLDNDESIADFRNNNKNKLPNRIVFLNNDNLENPKTEIGECEKYKDYFNSLKTKCWQEITKKYETEIGNYKISSKNNSFSIENQKDTYQIFKFEHHAKERVYLKEANFYNARVQEIQYYEPYGSSSALGNLLESSKKKTEQLHARMLEGICEKVAIIDERIQGTLDNTAYTAEENKDARDINDYEKLDEITYRQLFQLTNIEVLPLPEDSEDKGVQLTATLNKNALKNINKFIKESKAAFVVIHFGIIESLRLEENEKSIEALEKMLEGKPIETEIIITSGRGFTKDVQTLCSNEYKFINYSAFSNYVTDPHNRSKMHLIHLLKSLRI